MKIPATHDEQQGFLLVLRFLCSLCELLLQEHLDDLDGIVRVDVTRLGDVGSLQDEVLRILLQIVLHHLDGILRVNHAVAVHVA